MIKRLANRFFRWFCHPSYFDEIQGDLEEMYSRNLEKGKHYAQWKYLWQVLSLLRLSIIRSFSQYSLINLSMFRNYFKISFRILLNQKLYAAINILSLAVGMGICLLIYQYIHFEWSYDRFHPNHENTYRVIIEEINSESKESHPSVGHALGVIAKEEIPEVKQYIRKERVNRGAIVANPTSNNVFYEDINDLLFVDNSFFQTFHFPLEQGNEEILFKDKYSIVLTEETAKKYFGADDPIGKTLTINGPPSPGDYTVTGVLKDLPLNSHLQFDFLMPMENYLEYGWGGAVKKQDGWNGFSVVTYLTIDETANPDLVGKKLSDLITKYKNSSNNGNDIIEKVILQPIADIYLKSAMYSDVGFLNSTGSTQNIRIFALISFFILLIAYFNYINLSTAFSMHRAKEVGIRKSIGAFKKQLIGQFIIESVLINLFAAILSIGIAYLLLPVLNQIIGKELVLTILQDTQFWLWFLLIVLLGSFLSGLYPAFILSAFKPISMLGAYKHASSKNVNLRKSLIVVQFLISILLISSTYLIYKQTNFMKNRDLGIDMEKILVVKGPQLNQLSNDTVYKFPAFRNELVKHHSISAVTGSLMTPGNYWVLSYRKVGLPESATPHVRGFFTSIDFSKTYGLEFIAGNAFTEDMKDQEVVIINEAAVRAFDFSLPEDALQEKLVIGSRVRTIVGVVKNFHWHALTEAHTPYILDLYEKTSHPYVSIRMNLSDISGSIAHIESIYQTFFPGNPFNYFFADEAFNRQYHAEVQFLNLFSAFSLLAVFIACVGLFALVSFSATLRIKEIGIRKVLGANISDLMILLSREYLMLLFIAIIVAVPAIIFGGNTWLDNYAFKIEMSFDLFLIPALILVLISLLTVSYKTFVSAKANPVNSLRKE